MIEADRNKRNELMLVQIDLRYRAAFGAVLLQLERWEWRPRIQEAGRSDERQAELFRIGVTKVQQGGKHNRTIAGQISSHAADVLDDNSPLSENPRWYSDLAVAARVNGLRTGCFWGLPQSIRLAAQALLDELDREGLATLLSVKRGWDPCHVEVVS